MDTIANLKAFLEVARAGSFVGAARRLRVAPSVVTKRVEQLEWRTGQRLFERTTRRVSVTEAGRLFMPTAARLVNDLDDAIAQLQKRPRALEGRLRIKVPTTLSAFYLGGMLARFQNQHPNITMDVLALDRPVDPVQEGFDMAIGMFPASFGGSVDVGLCAVPRLAVAAPAYLARNEAPRHPSELLRHQILNFQPLGATWTFEGKTGPVAVSVTPRVDSNDGLILLQNALEGNGVTLLTSYLLLPAIQAGRLVTLLPEFRVADIWVRAMVPENRMQIERVQALLDFLRAEFSPVPPWERNTGSA
ncbi:transcriptional regulator [Pigmentiphaga sp. NML080357]|uniref:LysR family transcriptional regulator n=1 Tax=Pigmentiphaga sp. NML080357 TaxID=2008675 RepID=UPI000B419B2E|nr:LysR family transcriptional regulator [Pigmentiphaga sp. NML080357]OVZ56335.1 transcriptional regulator [Pigmentiphaga sp. NML080357]